MTPTLDTHLALWDAALRLLTALVLGVLIGWDRERREFDAGVRTMAMVSVGAAAFGIITLELGAALQAAGTLGDGYQYDPTRAIQGVVGGVGFLGAGMIIQRRGAVRGLTTAATIWAVAAVGLASGFGRYGVALMTAATVMLILVFMTLLKGTVLPESEDGPEPGEDHEAEPAAEPAANEPEDEKRDRPRG